MMVSQELLDGLWDFGDPVLSEQRFRESLRQVNFSASERAELSTQLARALGLQGRFDEGLQQLESLGVELLTGSVSLADSSATAENDDAADATPWLVAPQPIRQPDQDEAPVTVRILLEKGRLLNSSDRPTESIPFFRQAAELAGRNGLDFLRVDALHMLAIVDADQAQAWTERALAAIEAAGGSSAERDRIARWRVSLLNNLGWALHDAGEQSSALEAFEGARSAAEELGTEQQLFSARWAVARQLRELGRNQEALEIQQSLAAEDPQASYVQEELRELAKIFGR